MFGKIKSLEYSSIRNLRRYDWSNERAKLEFESLNLFIGKNGSGKSTIIDLLHCLNNSKNFYNIFRTNNYLESSEINVILKDKNSNVIEFKNHKKTNENEKRIEIRFIESNNNEPKIQEYFDLIINNHLEEIENKIKNILSKIEIIDIEYLRIEHKVNIETKTLVKFLNGLRKYMLNVNCDMKRTFKYKNGNDEVIEIALKNSPSFYNEVNINNIPSGWISIANTLGTIVNIKNSIILIEEPETHLHPTLQRVLIDRIYKNIKKNKNQIFIATHSPIFINSINNYESAKIFYAKGNVLEELKDDENKLIEDLGIKASDIFQTNGIIWIEGPSDRIYINNWLNRWCDENKKTPFIENVDYSFSMYGGASLKHFTKDISNEENDFIKLLKINKNNIIVMDRDNDYIYDNNEFILLNDTAKERIREQFKNNENTYVWLTEEYTIESYLDENFINKYFELTLDDSVKNRTRQLKKFENKSNKSKIQIANEYKNLNITLSEEISNHIENIYNIIKKWNN